MIAAYIFIKTVFAIDYKKESTCFKLLGPTSMFQWGHPQSRILILYAGP
jgi:hypothetical protein